MPFRSTVTIDPASVHGFDANLGTFVFAAAVQNIKLNGYSFAPVAAGCGKFENCFPNLAKASENLQPASLTEMQTYLAQQLAKGDAVFEAFGLKVPVEKLAIWGVVIVLAVQLYLFLQVKELHSKLKSSDSGWNVPWFGIYGLPPELPNKLLSDERS